MRNIIKKMGLTVVGVCIVLLASNCGGDRTSSGGEEITDNDEEQSGNEYLGQLPGMAAEYLAEYDRIIEEMEASTERDPYIGPDFNMLRPNADNAIEEYLENNPLRNLPFEQETNDPFNIEEIWVESATTYQLVIKARAILTEDIEGDVFAHFKAVDKEGNELDRSRGSFYYYQGSNITGVNTEIELSGSTTNLAGFADFDKFIFITEEEARDFSL